MGSFYLVRQRLSPVGEGLCALPLTRMVTMFRLQKVIEAANRSIHWVHFPFGESGGHREPPLPRKQRSCHAMDGT
jgi:hypothetical protein